MDGILGYFFSYDPTAPVSVVSLWFWMAMLVVLPAYFLICRRRAAMLSFVTLFSLFFAYKAGGWCVTVLLGKIVVDWLLVNWLQSLSVRRQRRTLLAVAITLSVATLAVFKYAGFAASLFAFDWSKVDWVVPVGISFYTFRSVSYLVEVYRGTVPPRVTLLEYAFYLSYFPALMAGPIVRADVFLGQLRLPVRITRRKLYSGLWLVLLGLLKKSAIADYLGQFNSLVFDNPSGYSGLENLLALLGYGAQIYFDFSGYSDMAIGLGRVMGIDLGVNFRTPYKSRNIGDFWRRWHISLSSWLRDYIYIPLGGSRNGRARMVMALMVTMVVGGIWHGAGWGFILWGFMHGLGLVVHKLFLARRKTDERRWRRWLSVAATFCFVTVLWPFFRASDFSQAVEMLRKIAVDVDFSFMLAFWAERSLWVVVFLLAYVLIFLPTSFGEKAEKGFIKLPWLVKLLLILVIVQTVLELGTESVAPFIYANF